MHMAVALWSPNAQAGTMVGLRCPFGPLPLLPSPSSQPSKPKRHKKNAPPRLHHTPEWRRRRQDPLRARRAGRPWRWQTARRRRGSSTPLGPGWAPPGRHAWSRLDWAGTGRGPELSQAPRGRRGLPGCAGRPPARPLASPPRAMRRARALPRLPRGRAPGPEPTRVPGPRSRRAASRGRAGRGRLPSPARRRRPGRRQTSRAGRQAARSGVPGSGWRPAPSPKPSPATPGARPSTPAGRRSPR